MAARKPNQTRQKGADPLAQMRGARSRAVGAWFEGQIAAACNHYISKGHAVIYKTPEPTKQLSKMDRNGRFTACYEKKAQPDFEGTLKTGRSVIFEAKYTSAGQIKHDAVTATQETHLNFHSRLGAVCFVLVAFGPNDIYRIPWETWEGMKRIYGRKYIKPEDVQEYRVHQRKGILDFLELYKV